MTSPSPPVVDRAEPKPPGPVKIDVPPPTAEVIVAPKPEKAGGINPTVRRSLADTLPSGVPVASLRPEGAPAEQPSKPAAQAPPTAAKLSTVPATPEALKKPIPNLPPVPAAAPKPATGSTSAARAALSALKPEAPQAPAKVAPPRVEPAPVSGPASVGTVVLENIEALADLPPEVHKTLQRAAVVEDVAPGDARVDFGAALVVSGEVSIAAAAGEGTGQTFQAPAFISARGTLAEGLSLRATAGASGATIARWTSGFFEETLKSCSWVIDDCRATADKLQASLGLSLGVFSQVDPAVRGEIAKRLETRVIEQGEVVTEENAPMPGLVIVVAGSVELLEGEPLAPVGEVRAGELLFADALWAGAPAPLTSRAAPSGAILLVGDRKAALDLAAEFPAVEEILSR